MDFKTAILHRKTLLTEDTYEFIFKTEESFDFSASQFVTISIPSHDGKTLMRSYSISCCPTENHFELCVKIVPDGIGSNYLKNLKEGEKIEFLGPLGHFTFKSPKDKTIFFVATGTGIAPIKSMLENELEQGNIQRMHLVFGLRYVKDIFYREVFEKLAEKHSNFTFDITLSRPEDKSWEDNGGKIGRVTDELKTLDINPNSTEFYICGLKDMVADTVALLEEKGISKEVIHFERFN